MKRRFSIRVSKYFLLFALMAMISSCTESDDLFADVTKKSEVVQDVCCNEKCLEHFAKILSKVVYERKDVRHFLKMETIKQFDCNYDVLYLLIKNKLINGESFEDILISYSSQEEMKEIEKKIPLLNILLPEISFFDIKAENLNEDDKEIPVSVSKNSETILYLKGKECVRLKKGEVPDFHVFVVNENSRVQISQNKTRAGNGLDIKFKSPNFNRALWTKKKPATRSIPAGNYIPGQKELEAYSYFNKDDGSICQKAFQRDYIYYGITPQKQEGHLNNSVTEYIHFIEINPNAYFKISDQDTKTSINDDPHIVESVTSHKKTQLTKEALIDRMWTKGAYDLKFEIIRSTSERPIVLYIPVKPSDIWDFHIKVSRRHATMFRHKKYTYTINPYNFTSKRYYLNPKQASLGKWNISEESLFRFINIYEEDESITKSYSYKYESVRARSNKFNGDIKLGVGLSDKSKLEIGASDEISSSNTVKESKSVTITRTEESDDLGTTKIYFYDPILDEKDVPHTYYSGIVEFGISVK